MPTRLAYVKERLETSIWLIPLGLCLLAIPLGLAALWLDRLLPPGFGGLGGFGLDAGAARHALGVIAGSVISVGGVGFSVTMVALTLTSGQYGPKILRNFLDDNSSKLSLGLFLATFVYTLVVLVGQPDQGKLQIGILGALALALAALIGFIHFIHRTATDLQADKIVQRIGEQLQQALAELARRSERPNLDRFSLPWRRAARGLPHAPVATRQQGYVQTIDYDALCRWCADNDARLLIRVRAGDFLVPGTRIATLYTPSRSDVDDVVETLDEAVVTGPIRTPVQDPEHAITQLNQLAARALSPGINDPGTAITCIDGFTLALSQAVDRDLPGSLVRDDQDEARLLVRGHRFEDLLKATYAPLRQYADGNVAVVIRLLKALCQLAEMTRRADRLKVLAWHGTLIWQAARVADLAAPDLGAIQAPFRRLCRLTHTPFPS